MLNQPVALVTGGSRGIGRGICLELACRGYAVAVNYAGNEAAAQEAQKTIESRAAVPCTCIQADVAHAADRNRLVDQVLGAWGRIDLLVNNAGITSLGRRDILEANEESWERVLAVNLKGPYFLTQRVAREMIQLVQRGPLHHPCVINIGSLSAYTVSTNRGDYCISKAGLSMLTKLWAVRLAEYGIRVFEVRPGIVETDLTAPVKDKYDKLIAEGVSPIRRWGRPEDVGKAVAALASASFPFSTGDSFSVDGGFHLRRL